MQSEKRIARLKRFGLSSPPDSRETLSAALPDDSDKLRARAKRFKMHGDQHIKASGAVDIDDFDSVRERYLSMKRRQERWGTTNEEAKRGISVGTPVDATNPSQLSMPSRKSTKD